MEVGDQEEFGKIMQPHEACFGLCLLPPPLREAELLSTVPVANFQRSEKGLLTGTARKPWNDEHRLYSVSAWFSEGRKAPD